MWKPFQRNFDRNIRRPETLIEVLGESSLPIEGVLELWHIAPAELESMNSNYLTMRKYLSSQDLDDFRGYAIPPLLAAITLHQQLKRQEFPDSGAPVDRFDGVVAILSRATRQLAEVVGVRADNRARSLLARGLLLSCVLVVATLAIVGLLIVLTCSLAQIRLGSSGAFELRDVLVCLAAGAAGAATSVVLRLRQIDRLGHETTNFGTALFRVALGVLFALGLLLLLKSGIVDVLKNPSSTSDTTVTGSDVGTVPTVVGYFWGGVGFLAGFNERWVGTLLNRDEK